MVKTYKLVIFSIAVILCGSFFIYSQHIYLGKTKASAITNSDSNKTKIWGVVIPHHDIVKDVRDELLKKITNTNQDWDTIILVSPNHFDSGNSKVQTSDKIWKTIGGTINPDNIVINALEKKGMVSIENESFSNEHGITNLLGEIKNFFPNSTIIPIIIKRDVSKEDLNLLNESLKKRCKKCLMIASVDFSHYEPAILADLHDKLSLRGLQNLDTDSLLYKSEVDSPESLTLLAMWSLSHKANKFELFEHTNSGAMFNNLDSETTSHIFGWYEVGEKNTPKKTATFIIAGDAMFARGVESRYGNNFNQVFDNLGDRFFWGTDTSVINLEGAISEFPDAYQKFNDEVNGYTFIFHKIITQVLNDVGIKMVSLANNHSNNAGTEGIMYSRKILTESDISWFGNFYGDGVYKISEFSGEGINVAIIGVNATTQFPDFTEEIKSLKLEGKKVIVFPHWGDEYFTKHNYIQEKMAKDWIDAGADIVIGSHPHVVQDVGVHNDKPIIYSLGNFIFDQNFSEDVMRGMVVAGEFTESGIRLFAMPIKNVGYKPTLLTGDEKNSILNNFYKPWLNYEVKNDSGRTFFFPY